MVINRLGDSAQPPQTPHIEPDVDDADVYENTAQQPPPLAANCVGAVICSPMPQLGRCWRGERDAGQCHGDEHRNINPKNGLSDHHRTGLLPLPGRRFDSLDGRILATLCRFMLHAPLTKLLAEGEGWKLTTALNAICHVEERSKPARPLIADYHDVGGAPGVPARSPRASNRESTLPI